MTNEHLFNELTRAKTEGNATDIRKLREQIFAKNIGFAYSAAKKYANKYQSLEHDDLLQDCLIELWRIVDTFDPTRGYTFGTYALPCLWGICRRAIRLGGTIHIPVYVREDLVKIRKLSEEWLDAFGCEPTRDELLEWGFRPASVRAWFDAPKLRMVSFDAPIGEDGSLHDILPAPAPEEGLARDEIEVLYDALDALPPKDREILIRRANNETLHDVGQTFGVTREAIRQHQVRATRRLAAQLRKTRYQISYTE